jgi:hypothetical protein
VGKAPLTVSNNWYYGLYVSYWNDCRFAGKIASRDAGEIARELAALGEVRVLVFHDADLARRLAAHGAFVPHRGLDGPVWSFDLRTNPD